MSTEINSQYVKPIGPFIGSRAEKLYKREAKRSEIIRLAAEELGKVLGHEKNQYWTHTLPEELLTILESYDRDAAKIAAIAFLEKQGFTVTPQQLAVVEEAADEVV